MPTSALEIFYCGCWHP